MPTVSTAPSPPPPAADALEDAAVMACVEQVMAELRRQPPVLTPAWPSDPPPPSARPPRPAVSIRTDPDEEYRLWPRRPVTHRVGAAVRKGTLRLGRDHGIDLADAAEDGLGVRLRAPLAGGDEVTVELSRPGVGRPLALAGDVRWCHAAGDGTFLAGVRLRRRLTYLELTNLTG